MRRRTLVWIVGVVVALGAAAAIVLIAQPGDEPDRGAAGRTQEFLKGAGAPLLTMHDTARAVADGTSDCPAATARLDRDLPPDQAVLLLGSVEDGELESYLAEERQTLGRTLAACGKDPGLAEAVRKVQSRLDALGVRR